MRDITILIGHRKVDLSILVAEVVVVHMMERADRLVVLDYYSLNIISNH